MQYYIDSLQNDLKDERNAKIDPRTKTETDNVTQLKVESELVQELKRELQVCWDAVTQK